MQQQNKGSLFKEVLPSLLYGIFLFCVFNIPAKLERETADRLHIDKIFHIILFAILSILLLRFIRKRRPTINILFCILITLTVSAGCAVTTELQQKLNPYHTCDEYDLIADLVGALIGALIYLPFLRSRPAR